MANLLNGRKQSLRGGGFRRFSAVVNGGDKLGEVSACGGSRTSSGGSNLSFSLSSLSLPLKKTNVAFGEYQGRYNLTKIQINKYEFLIKNGKTSLCTCQIAKKIVYVLIVHMDSKNYVYMWTAKIIYTRRYYIDWTLEIENLWIAI